MYAKHAHTKYTNFGKAQDCLVNLPRQIPDVSHLSWDSLLISEMFSPQPLWEARHSYLTWGDPESASFLNHKTDIQAHIKL